MTDLLKATDVCAGYGKMQILNDVSMRAETGKVTVVVGPNGSGKSTLLKSIAGLANVFSGSVELAGAQIKNRPASEIARAGLAYLPQTRNVFADLSVRENLMIAGYIVSKQEFSERLPTVIELFPQLSKYLGAKTSNLSGGERQMLAMAMALLKKPVAIMLDEPTANLAPKIASQVLDIVSSITKKLNLATVLVEQNAVRALQLGDSACLLVGGRNAFTGTCKELLEHAELGPLYLGLRAT